jgi:hypothetical protein
MATALRETQAQLATQDVAEAASAGAWKPYRRSWLDWLVGAMETLLGRTWAAYMQMAIDPASPSESRVVLGKPMK